MTVRAAIGDSLRGPRGQLLLLLLLALAARAAALYLGDTALALKGDEGYYLRHGQAIAQGLGHPGSFRPPLYPLLIGAIVSSFGSSLTALRWAQVLISLVGVALLYDVCRIRFGARAAFVSGLAVAISPTLAHYTHFLWSETLFITLLLLFFWMLRRFDVTGRGRFIVGAGLALSLAALTKEIVVFFAVLMLPWFAFRAGQSRRAAVRHAAIFFVCFLLPIIPWTVRNWRIQGTFVGLSTCRWFPIAVGNLRAEDALRDSTKREEFRREWDGMTDELEREALSRGAALKSIRAQQPWWILHKVRFNLPRLLSPKGQEILFLERGLYPQEVGPLLARASIVTSLVGHLLLVPLGLMGLWLIRGDPLKWAVLALLAYAVAVYVVANANPRFLVPLLPLFYLYIGPLTTEGLRKCERWRWAGAMASVAAFLVLVLPQVPDLLRSLWSPFG